MRVIAQSRLRIFLLCLAMLCSSLGLVILGPATPAKADPPCMTNGGVYVVFVRGSGEHIDGPRATAFKNAIFPLLPVNKEWVELGNLANSTPPGGDPIAASAYKAVGWADWGIFDGMDGYFNSVWTGVDELTRHLNDRAARCPKESIVIGGYSQGAQVVDQALLGVYNYTLSRIGYVALYGDPRSTACDTVNRAPWARGSANCARGSLGTQIPYARDDLIYRTGSWCDSHDGVCTGNKVYLPLFNNPLSTHGSAYQERWIPDSAPEVANKALSRYNMLNPNSPVSLPSYIVSLPDTSADSPAAPPPAPTIKSIKRTVAGLRV